MKRQRHRPTGGGREISVQIAFDRRVLEYIRAELAKSPTAEEGGKYVGYLLPEGSSNLGTVGLERGRPGLVVTDFLPSGPNAVRTAVELQPDGEYQEGLFRQLERLDSEIEHLGTWHSHHCNGLQTLSGGDVDGYYRTVNRPAYRPDCFLASLVTRMPTGTDDVGWIEHFLFVRGRREHHQVTDSIQIVDWPSRFAGLIDHFAESTPPSQRQPEALPEPTPPTQNGGQWYESAEGRRILAEDKRSFATKFKDKIVATRRGRAITMTGQLGEASVRATYPEEIDASQIVVSLTLRGATLLQINADLHWRELAFTAAVAAAESLRPESL